MPAFEAAVHEQEIRARTLPFELAMDNRRARNFGKGADEQSMRARNQALADELASQTEAVIVATTYVAEAAEGIGGGMASPEWDEATDDWGNCVFNGAPTTTGGTAPEGAGWMPHTHTTFLEANLSPACTCV